MQISDHHEILGKMLTEMEWEWKPKQGETVLGREWKNLISTLSFSRKHNFKPITLMGCSSAHLCVIFYNSLSAKTPTKSSLSACVSLVLMQAAS